MNSETQLEFQQEEDESLPDCCNRNGCLVRELLKLVLWCDRPKSVLALALLHVFINYAAKKSLICAVMLLTMIALTSSIFYDLYLCYKQFNEGDPIQAQPYMTLFLCPEWSTTLTQSLNMCLAKIPLIAGLQNPFLAFTLMNVFMYVYFVGNLVSGTTLATCGLDAADLAQKKIKQHKMEKQNIGEAHNEDLEPQGSESSTEPNNNQKETFALGFTLDSIDLNDTEDSLGLNDTVVYLGPNNTFELNDTPETIVLDDTQKSLVLNDTVKPSEPNKTFNLNDTQESVELHDSLESYLSKKIEESFGLNDTQESIEPNNSQDSSVLNDTQDNSGLNMTEEAFGSIFAQEPFEESFEPKNTQALFAETAQKDVKGETNQ
ncbi:uncharacterized protein DMAD_05966 [Drosophila madeirensis]|uniref:Uncharacterized protein n=1 Tax=Drosophila madeirensis TaxID=30013 RepID=A0AAU9FPG7_DROMD